MSRLPIRVRLTVLVAGATMVVLVGAGLFVYVRLRADLNEGVNANLHTRAAAITANAHGALTPSAGAGGGQPEETFSEVLGPGGRVLDATPGRWAAHA